MTALLAWLIAYWQFGKSHADEDLKRDIKSEVSNQLTQRQSDDTGNLNNRIATEIGKQLAPVNQTLQAINLDIGKIKDHLGIARNVAPRTGPSVASPLDVGLRRFEKMNKQQFAMSLPALRTVIQRSSAPVDQSTLRNIAEKLRETDARAPGYWPTVFAFITWTSATSARDVPRANAKTTLSIANTPPLTANVMLDGLVVALDGGTINGLTFRNCRIRFTSNAVQMNNVTFVNCVFEFPSIQSPTPYLKRATKELLQADNLTSISLTLHG
jgi:hypothetical protein